MNKSNKQNTVTAKYQTKVCSWWQAHFNQNIWQRQVCVVWNNTICKLFKIKTVFWHFLVIKPQTFNVTVITCG